MDHLLTALFCTIHLCVGYFAGRRSIAAARSARTAAALRKVMPAVNGFDRAYVAVAPQLSQLPSDLQAAVAELRQSVHVFVTDVTKEAAPPPAAESNQHETSPEKAIGRLDGREAPRRGYAKPEFMAVWHDDLSTVQKFESVICHDLSTSGISYFLQRPLDRNDNVLITLGWPQSGVIMAGRIVYSRAVIMRGEDRYRIGCEFVRRLKDEEVARIEPLLATMRNVYSITSVCTSEQAQSSAAMVESRGVLLDA